VDFLLQRELTVLTVLTVVPGIPVAGAVVQPPLVKPGRVLLLVVPEVLVQHLVLPNHR
jgi:hypothetical protein